MSDSFYYLKCKHLAFLTFWDGPHSICGVCFSLSKPTSYLSLCLSLNSFYDETSRTWASLSPETRCVISVGRLWVLAGFESQQRGFESQSGFWPGSSTSSVGSNPSVGFGRVWVLAAWVQVSIWGARFQLVTTKGQRRDSDKARKCLRVRSWSYRGPWDAANQAHWGGCSAAVCSFLTGGSTPCTYAHPTAGPGQNC